MEKERQGEIKTIIASSGINGGRYWARKDGDIHAPAGSSTIDVLSTLGDLGVKYGDYGEIREAVDFVFRYYSQEGSFRYSEKSSKLPCITARILTAFGRLGYSDERVEKCYDSLLQFQGEDGGWRCNTVKIGKSKATDAGNPGTTLYVLEAFSYRKNTIGDLEKLEKGAQFLLKHWETRAPLGPCAFGIGTTFIKIEYPMLRYNILYYCHALSKYKKARSDRRFKAAVKELESRLVDGKLIVENPHKAWQGFVFARKGAPSAAATKKYRAITMRSRGSSSAVH
jgi:hypothetical protein